MEFLNKYFSKEVFKNTFFCLLGYIILIVISGLLNGEQSDPYSNFTIIWSIIFGILNAGLIFLMIFFFYRDFKHTHMAINLKEILTIGMIIYGLMCLICIIKLAVEDHFKFSSYFIDVCIVGILSLFVFFFIVFLLFINILGMWKIFEKAGEPGWASIVPFYNIIVMLKIVEKPSWWFILFLIPLVNIIISIMVAYALSKKFGKYDDFVFGLVLLPFIFYPILGFGDAEYDVE